MSQTISESSTVDRKPFRRLLLTGGAGNLGRQLRGALAEWAEVVRVTDIASLGEPAAHEETSVVDLADRAAVMQLVEGVDAIVHLGGISIDAPFNDAPTSDRVQNQETIEARCVINCAGLYADDIAAMLGNRNYRIYPVRGEYCELVRAKSYLVNNLVYPLPHSDGLSLGVHLTRTLWGTVLVGPTADYVQDKNDYERNRLPIEEFVRRAKPLLPEIEAADLQLAYSGIRAKLAPPGHAGIADFVISRDANVPSAIQLIGIESPGLTSSLAIADRVVSLAAEILD